MELYYLKEDVKVFGVQVKTFPDGIGEAFDALVKMIPGGFNRSYYGISYMEGNDIIYKAMAEEVIDGEAEKYNYERFTIKKGEYLAVTVMDWLQKTGSIKDVFHDMMQDSRADNSSPCVEWYKNDNEMICMLKTNRTGKEAPPFIKTGIHAAKK
jgi:predicted transcriptional regulator YdeE